jgi:hypothetical protein
MNSEVEKKMDQFNRYSLNKLLNIRQVINDDEISTISQEISHLNKPDKAIIFEEIKNGTGTDYTQK